MAEIISYKGKVLALGTEMNLWHVSYFKLYQAYHNGHLKRKSSANLEPIAYLAPDSVFRFRFPFPDETELKLGMSVDFRKNVPVNIQDDSGEIKTVYISQQKCLSRPDQKSAYLATLYRDESGMEIYELTDRSEAENFTRQIAINHLLDESDTKQQAFFYLLIESILGGYDLEISFPEK